MASNIQVPSPKSSPISSPTSPTGIKRVGQYRLLEAIGEGRFGKVFRAQHDDGKLFAIKTAPKTVPRAVAEINVLQQIPSHPSVIETYYVLESVNNWYIVMELAKMSMYQLLVAVRRLEEATARQALKQIATGLKHCRAHGVAHRDVKLENILIIEVKGLGFRAALADFGWAYYHSNPEDDETQHRTFCGSLHYMAPELLSEERCYDPYVADVWSLGVVLFAMVSGYLPFDGVNQVDIASQIRRGQPRYPPSLSPELKDLIQRLFTVSASERPSLDFVLDHTWTSCVPETSPK